jgi:hypothetical protein
MLSEGTRGLANTRLVPTWFGLLSKPLIPPHSFLPSIKILKQPRPLQLFLQEL